MFLLSFAINLLFHVKQYAILQLYTNVSRETMANTLYIIENNVSRETFIQNNVNFIISIDFRKKL